MKRFCLMFALFSVFCSPILVEANVHISEIAWMGTTVSANDEWIELWNDGNESVSLTGWKLSWGSGTPKVITLSGSIPASGYYLLERTDDSTVSGVTADLVFTGALSNSGESITLKNEADVVVDSASFSSGWPAGDNVTKDTMQLVGGSWISGPATPRIAPVVTGNDSLDVSTATTTATSTQDTINGTPNGDAPSAHAASEPLSDDEPDPTFTISLGRDRLAVIDSPVRFSARAWLGKVELPATVNYAWSFGDGESAVGSSVQHRYRFPGRYVVVLNGDQGRIHAVDRAEVLVSRATLSLRDGDNESVATIENTGAKEINIGGFVVRSGKTTFTFPDDTLLLPKQALSLDEGKLPSDTSSTTVLLSPQGRELGKISRKNPSSTTLFDTKSTIPDKNIATIAKLREQVALMREQILSIFKQRESQGGVIPYKQLSTSTPFTAGALSAIVSAPKK